MRSLKPFNLKEALSGKTVMLRSGRKAYVRHHETDKPVRADNAVWGVLDDGRVMTWAIQGCHVVGSTSQNDIVGMYTETLIINGFEVPAPEINEPKHGDDYYLAETTGADLYRCETWTGHRIDKLWLKRGLVFLNLKDAVATAKAMMGIDPNSEDEA